MIAGPFRLRDLLWIIAAGPACWPLALQIRRPGQCRIITSTGPVAPGRARLPVAAVPLPGQWIWAAWTGADALAVATLQIYGTAIRNYRRRQALHREIERALLEPAHGDRGRRGPARLGHPAPGQVPRIVTNAARAIWLVLAGRFPGALTVIEQWPAGQSPETGEHYDLMQAPPGTAPGWSRLWPAHPEHPQAAVYVAWMARWGTQIRETAAGRFFSGDPARQARAYLLTDEAAAAIAGQAAFPALDEVSRRAADPGGG
jgi:hypothetical protein